MKNLAKTIPSLFLVALLAGCSLFQGTQRVFELAQGPAQTAKAGLLLHNATGNFVASMVEDPEVSESTKTRIRDLYRRTVCSTAESTVPTSDCDEGPSYRTDNAVKAYENVQNATTEAEVIAANEALVALLVDLSQLINSGSN
jgi:hypothetical protein